MKNKTKEMGDAIQAVKDGRDFNLKTDKGFIYCAGGILCKLEDNKHFIAINRRWKNVNE